MAVPGFSITELIQALGQVKVVYDAFCNTHKGSAAQVRYLAEDIEQFRINLKNHQGIIERRGLEYPSYHAVERTLEECRDFLKRFEVVLANDARRFSIVGAYKTARYAFVQDEVAKLRAQISTHGNNILHFSMNIVLENLSPPANVREDGRGYISAVSGTSAMSRQPTSPMNIPNAAYLYKQTWGFSLGQEEMAVNDFKTEPMSPSPSYYTERPTPPLFSNPTLHHDSIFSTSPGQTYTTPGSPSVVGRDRSMSASPRTGVITPELQAGSSNQATDTNLDSLLLPQPALPYNVAKVIFGTKEITLKRKPTGREYLSSRGYGREFIIIDENGNMRFVHRVRSSQKQNLYPYTWHRNAKSHSPLEITFKGPPPDAHSITFKGIPAGNGIPKYIFTSQQDFIDFQSEVRGKDLVASFNFRKILSSSSPKGGNGEATDQHLKIWRDRITQDHSLSFYANAIEKPRDFEFPINFCSQELPGKNTGREVELNFSIAGEKRKFSKAFSRSSTSSTESFVPGIFSKAQTVIASSNTSVTTISRDSIASFDGLAQGDRKGGLSALEAQAKQMKYVRIEFSDDQEAISFRELYFQIYKEEASRPLDYFLSWQLNSVSPGTGSATEGTQRPESVVSNQSASGGYMNPASPGEAFRFSPVLLPRK